MIHFEETHTGGEALSDEQWSDRATSYCEHTITAVSFSGEGADVLSFLAEEDRSDLELLAETGDPWRPGRNCWLVEVTYGTGDTFGRNNGHWEVMGIYKTKAEADAGEAAIQHCSDHGDSGSHSDECWKGPRPWEGFFQLFESVSVSKFILQP